MKHFQTNNPLLYKSAEEKKDLEKSMRKYVSFEKHDEVERKAAAMFGGAAVEVADLDDSFESGDSTASQSDAVDEECQGLFFSVEEIELMSDADKVIYMGKLQQDYQVIQAKLDEVIERVKNARQEAKQSIQGGQDTLAMYADYFARMNKLESKTLKNLGCEPNHCGMGHW